MNKSEREKEGLGSWTSGLPAAVLKYTWDTYFRSITCAWVSKWRPELVLKTDFLMQHVIWPTLPDIFSKWTQRRNPWSEGTAKCKNLNHVLQVNWRTYTVVVFCASLLIIPLILSFMQLILLFRRVDLAPFEPIGIARSFWRNWQIYPASIFLIASLICQ